jgi:hypothetical protein
MPRDFIKIALDVTTATHARALKNFVQQFREAYEQGVAVKSILDHNTDGSNYADIEALFGVPAGQGQTVYNLVAGAVGAMSGTVQSGDGKTLTERVG